MDNSFLNTRRDLQIVSRLIEPDSRILDLGCGDGLFLAYLKKNKNASVLGLELEQQQICKCIANGVPVIQSNLNRKLDFADDKSFDYVILSHTLQELENPALLLEEIVRVGKKAVVSFINFGYFPNRLQLLFTGRMPRNKSLPHEWYNTPNIHLGTIADFQRLCAEKNICIEESIALGSNWDAPFGFGHNLFAPGCVFVLSS
ncbi:MAG: methionine biosynthesis protein MetW [Lentisphaeria bacterium]|nr:methionine biosynthesis protein MetW [Lentisphaeria bacterium]